jgi:uncharacterized protein (TIGR02118 family)
MVVKLVFLWRHHPERTPEECRAHYRDVHAALGIECFKDAPGFRGLIQNWVVSHTVHDYNAKQGTPAEPEFDGMVELYFDDRESLDRAMAAGPTDATFADHANFMDVETQATLKVYELEESIILQRDFRARTSDAG